MRLNKYSWLVVIFVSMSVPALAEGLTSAVVTQSRSGHSYAAEGVVEAVKSSVIAPQVEGSVTTLAVKAGDHVKAGQLLARIDSRLATQQAMTNQAEVAAAQAQLSAARKEYERKRRLYEKEYISQAALERAESDFKTAEAQAKAQLAQTGMSKVQTGFHALYAPYAGIVAEVMAEVGDMAMPGKPLLMLYEPAEMRVVVNVPQTQIANIRHGANVRIVIPAVAPTQGDFIAGVMTILPTADPVSNMVKVRLALPQHTANITPGMFARAILPVTLSGTKDQLLVPAQAVIRRSELTAVYVLDGKGKATLRQVRIGRRQGENVEVFAGLQAGERVALDPVAAARLK